MKKTVWIAALSAIATAAVLGFGAASSGATLSCDRYASPTGSDSAGGTTAAPVPDRAKLVGQPRRRPDRLPAAGRYNENLTIKHGGSPGAPITLTSAPGERATARRPPLDRRTGRTTSSSRDLEPRRPQPEQPAEPDHRRRPRSRSPSNEVTNQHTAICFILGSASGCGLAERRVIDGNRIHDCGQLPGHEPRPRHLRRGDAQRRITRQLHLRQRRPRHPALPGRAGNADRRQRDRRQRRGDHLLRATAASPPSDNVVANNIISNSRVRYNVEYWWPGRESGRHRQPRRGQLRLERRAGQRRRRGRLQRLRNKAVNPLYTNRRRRTSRSRAAARASGTARPRRRRRPRTCPHLRRARRPPHRALPPRRRLRRFPTQLAPGATAR